VEIQQDDEALRVLVVHDHPLLASAIAGILEKEPDVKVCGIARTGAEAAVAAMQQKAAVVVMDFTLPDMSGPAAAAAIRAQLPGVSIVFHGAEESDSALLDAIDAGAMAYLTKLATADQIVEAVKRASKGEVLIPVSLFAKAIARRRSLAEKQAERQRRSALLTVRELEILELLAQGEGTIAMSQRLGISANTIEWHVGHLIDKLGVHSKLQAVIAAARLGLIDVGSHNDSQSPP
jgi:DNA-binding NarL/FixJ family response regulator